MTHFSNNNIIIVAGGSHKFNVQQNWWLMMTTASMMVRRDSPQDDEGWIFSISPIAKQKLRYTYTTTTTATAMKKGGRILTSTSRFRKGAPPATVNWSHTTERKRERNWDSHNRTHTCATAVRAYTGTDQSRPWESSGLFPSPDQPRQGNHREQFGYYVKTETPLWAERIGTRRGHTQHFWEQQ